MTKIKVIGAVFVRNNEGKFVGVRSDNSQPTKLGWKIYQRMRKVGYEKFVKEVLDGKFIKEERLLTLKDVNVLYNWVYFIHEYGIEAYTVSLSVEADLLFCGKTYIRDEPEVAKLKLLIIEMLGEFVKHYVGKN